MVTITISTVVMTIAIMTITISAIMAAVALWVRTQIYYHLAALHTASSIIIITGRRTNSCILYTAIPVYIVRIFFILFFIF